MAFELRCKRALIDKSEEWEHDAWGGSVNAAHLALATAAFSARLTQFAQMLGAELDNKDDREAFMAVWCYDAWLMGVPETLLFHSQEEGLRLFEVGTTCEPPPDEDAIALANCIVNSAPVVIDITEPKARRDFAQHAYRIARELVGHAQADRLNFSPKSPFPILPWLRMQERIKHDVVGAIPFSSRSGLPILRNVRDARNAGPILAHVLTQKGKGYPPAEQSADKYHGVSSFAVETGTQIKAVASAPSFTKVFGESLLTEARRDDRVCAITAAMPSGTGVNIM